MVERLRRDPGVSPLWSPLVLHAGFVLTTQGREALQPIYQEYLDIARRFGLPLLLFTPTWRANPERSQEAGFRSGRELNRSGVRYLKELLARQAPGGPPVLLGGLLGCRGDAYRPEEGLPAEKAARYHREQAEALAEAGADFLFASTLPALPEALGMAEAMAATGSPWALSFLPRSDGTLLDGAPLEVALSRVEEIGSHGPLYLAANCVYPTVLEAGLQSARSRGTDLSGRFGGLQANGSSLPPEMLDGLDHLDAEPAETFARDMLQLKRNWGIKVLGGCCGTDGRHLAGLAEGLVGDGKGE